jgi:glycosyltransferase involved in cell wall biosynthesis
MNILIFNWQCISNPFGGGAEVHLHEIFSRIAKMGHKVVLYCCMFEGAKEFEVIDGIEIHRYGSRNLFNFHVKKLYKLAIQETEYDIVIDDINKIPFYLPCFVKKPLLAISHHFFGKSIFKEAGLISGSYVYFSEFLVNYIYKKTPFAVVSESTLAEFVERKFDRNNFDIIYNAIDTAAFPFEHNQTDFENYRIAYFGRLKKYKSVEQLFYSFKEFHDKYPNSQLEIIGRGDYREFLESLAVKLGFADKVIFYGFVPNEEKVRILTEVDVVVNTSQKEGWGITNIEANACGTPVISANVPGLRDSVDNGISGLLYEYGNIQDLTKHLEIALIDTKMKQHLREGAVAWALIFSWDFSAEKMLKLCEKVINNFSKKI